MAMKNIIVNRRVRSLFVGGAAALLCGAVVISAQAVAPETFTALVSRLQAEKPKFAKRQQDLLAERYDLADRPAKGTTMSRGKPVQDGVRVKLPAGMTWEKLAAMSPEEIKEKQPLAGRLSSAAASAPRSGRHDLPQIPHRGNEEADRSGPDALRPRLRLAGPFAARVPGTDLSDDAAGSGRRLARETGDAQQLQRIVQRHPQSQATRRIAAAGHAVSRSSSSTPPKTAAASRPTRAWPASTATPTAIRTPPPTRSATFGPTSIAIGSTRHRCGA